MARTLADPLARSAMEERMRAVIERRAPGPLGGDVAALATAMRVAGVAVSDAQAKNVAVQLFLRGYVLRGTH